ncbi:MAG: Fe-S-binding domain-containing protein, partial [Anaerolineae bacterium]
MDFIQHNLLTVTVFFPLLAGLLIFLVPEDEKTLVRRLAFALSLVPLVLVMVMWFNYDRVSADLQFEVVAQWFPAIGSSFHMGIDGISLAMFLLTTILTPLSILASFNIEKNVKMFMFLFLLMETAMLGLFAAMDLIIF